MMKKVISMMLGIFFLVFTSCNNKNNTHELEGQIYIKLIDFGNLQELDKDRIDSIKKEIKSDNKVVSKEERDVYNYFNLIFENKLENKSTFFLELNGNNNPQRFFVSPEEYKPIEDLIKNLDKNNERIELVLQAEQIEEGIFLVEKINSIQKTSGRTNWSK